MRDGAPIPHSKPSIGELEVEAAARVLLSGHLAQGEEVAAAGRAYTKRKMPV